MTTPMKIFAFENLVVCHHFNRNEKMTLPKYFEISLLSSHKSVMNRFPFMHEGFSAAVQGYDYIFWDINLSYAWDFIPWLTTVFGIGSSSLRDLSFVCNSVK
jgi:hypothetical protein